MKVQIYCISGGVGVEWHVWGNEAWNLLPIWKFEIVILRSSLRHVCPNRALSALFSIKSFPIDTKIHKIEQSSAFYGIKVVFKPLTLIQAGPWTNSRVVTMTTGLVHVYGLWDAEYEMADTQTGIRGNRPDQGVMVVLSPHLLVEVVTVCMTPSPA